MSFKVYAHLSKSPTGRGKMKILSSAANQVTVINKLIILDPAPGEGVKIIWSIIKSRLFILQVDASLDIWPKHLLRISRTSVHRDQ